MIYDYSYTDAENGHIYEIFEIKGGKVIGYADSREEAIEKIAKLEPERKKMEADLRNLNREMILHPLRWPYLVLPLKRKNAFEDGNTAVFAPPIGIEMVRPDVPIEIRIGTLFDELSELPRKTYLNVDALLDDGWIVDMKPANMKVKFNSK